MKLIQRNLPMIVGWLAYYALKTALSAVLMGTIYYLLSRFFSISSKTFVFVLSIGISALSGFLSFLVSAKWIVLPLSKRAEEIGETTKFKQLFGEWILLGVCVLLYGRLPLILLSVFSLAKDTRDLIASIWVAFISFMIYIDIFSNRALPSVESAIERNNKPLNEV